MPERSFGRTVRYRRTKLGLSQAKLGDLVGRSPATIRSWERDSTQPNDPKILSALAAILAIDERMLFDKAGVEVPAHESEPTVEQALATLRPEGKSDRGSSELEINQQVEGDSHAEDEPAEREEGPDGRVEPFRPRPTQPQRVAYTVPPEPLPITHLTPSVTDLSYIEDESQKQMYRVRNLATMVVGVVLVIAFIWAISEGWGALGEWWDEFFGNLRL
jgi:transcriptional regulator with XRE-family HTH domain